MLTDGLFSVLLRYFTFPLRDTDKVRWSNVQRKAQFPPAYQCTISSCVLPEIDGVRDWTKAKDWKAINCWWGWHYHKALSAGWDHKLSWAPPVFMTGERENWGAEECVWHWISINRGTGSVSLSLFLSHSAPILLFSSSLCLLLFLGAILISLPASPPLDFLLADILRAMFLWHSHTSHFLTLLCRLPSFLNCLSVTHWGVDTVG